MYLLLKLVRNPTKQYFRKQSVKVWSNQSVNNKWMHLFADWFNFDSFNLIILISVIKTNWGSFVSTTRNSNFEWTLLLEVHGNDSFSNLRFHFDLHMCHSLSIKIALLYRKVCNKTCCSQGAYREETRWAL